MGECKDCGAPLYGDSYGPAGHACPKYVDREQSLLALIREMRDALKGALTWQPDFVATVIAKADEALGEKEK